MDYCELFDRIGEFWLNRRTIEEDPELFMEKIFSKMIIVRCELYYDRMAFLYTAISPLFDKVDKGAMPPRYMIVFTPSGPVLERQDG